MDLDDDYNSEDEDYEYDEEEEDDDDEEEEMEEATTNTKSKTKRMRKKDSPVESIKKLNVIFKNSNEVAKCIQYKEGNSIIVKFTNFAISAPAVSDTDINENLEPCPSYDTTDVLKCNHVYIKIESQMRRSDEITNVIKICNKCGSMKIS
ncbi:LEF-5 [Aratus pisonii nudivirus]|nr:LEF-5 [Aratus pisonii nudivirus]